MKGKNCKVVPVLATEVYRGSRGIAPPLHDHGIRKGVKGQRHAPAALYTRERPGTHCIGSWVGPRAGLDRCGKSHPPPGFDPRTVQPLASCYTDCATRPTFGIIPHGQGKGKVRPKTRHECPEGL